MQLNSITTVDLQIMGDIVPTGPLRPECAQPQWYVAQTFSRREKRVAAQLNGRGIEHFLPLYSFVSRWKDRRVRLDLPLFAGYVFVRLPLAERLRVLEIPGVARMVGFGGLPVPLPDHEMEAMRNGVTRQMRAEPHPYVAVGRRVRITSGPLQGLQGILISKANGYRFVLSLDLIQRSIAVQVDAADVVVV